MVLEADFIAVIIFHSLNNISNRSKPRLGLWLWIFSAAFLRTFVLRLWLIFKINAHRLSQWPLCSFFIVQRQTGVQYKIKNFLNVSPDFELVSKNGFSLKLPVGLPFFSFSSKANILLAEDAISWELLVTRLFWCLLPSQDSLVRMRSAVVDSVPLAREEIYPVRCHRS